MNIRFNNYAKKVGKKGDYDWYQWRLFVDEDDKVLKKIEHVQYLLHRTFPNPSRISDDWKSKFALDSSGWGSFTVYVTVRFKDGTEEEQEYYLDLGKEWPK